jgi:hypothetical protein
MTRSCAKDRRASIRSSRPFKNTRNFYPIHDRIVQAESQGPTPGATATQTDYDVEGADDLTRLILGEWAIDKDLSETAIETRNVSAVL